MSYRAGVGFNLSRQLGYDGPDFPHIVCDGCGAIRQIFTPPGREPAWFFKGRPPPKWKGHRRYLEDGSIDRKDWCPQCKDGVP